jgi:HK97 family phage prohead protease
MDRKIFQLKDAKMSDDHHGTLEGYGAVYGNVDLGGDVLERDSCANVEEFVKNGTILVGHAWGALGVATIDDAKQDAIGLWFRANYHSDADSQKARTVAKERLERNKFVGLSIGYATIDATYGEESGRHVRRISKWNAYEISQVTTPMNPLAGATGAKSFDDQYGAALAAVKELVDRAKGIQALRQKDGRDLSALNRSRIEALAAETEGLLPLIKDLLSRPDEPADEAALADVRLWLAKQRAGSLTPSGASK